jgi:hypothetical protein
MTLLGWYVTVGLPLILIAMAYGAVRLADRDRARLERERAADAQLRS